jgi:general stress protein YciG
MPDRDQSHTSNRGFASMDEKKQRDIASKGGQASGGNFKNDPERASEAGRKGGQSVPPDERSFSRDHELAAEAGRKGGEHSHGGQIGSSHQGSSHQGGRDNAAEDRERASEAGRKGGEHSHDRR